MISRVAARQSSTLNHSMAYPRWPTEQNLPPLASPPPHLTRRRRRWSEEENLPPPETPATLNVVIPHGCGPGDTIQVESPSGKSLDVVVPPGFVRRLDACGRGAAGRAASAAAHL